MGANKIKPPTLVGRYTYEAVAHEIARAIKRGERGTHAALARQLKWTSQQLSHRLAGTYARFELEHYGVIADFMAAHQGLAGYGRGWPLISYEELKDLRGDK